MPAVLAGAIAARQSEQRGSVVDHDASDVRGACDHLSVAPLFDLEPKALERGNGTLESGRVVFATAAVRGAEAGFGNATIIQDDLLAMARRALGETGRTPRVLPGLDQ